MFERLFEKKYHRKQQDTIVDPPNKPYYYGSECNFKWKDPSSDQVKEAKNVKEKSFSKGKAKGMLKKNHNHIHQEAAGPGHNSVPPYNKHTLFRG